MMSSGDRTSFDNNHQNSSASFPAATLSGLDHSVKSVKLAESNFRRLNAPMEMGGRNGGLNDTARSPGILKEIDSKAVNYYRNTLILLYLKRDGTTCVFWWSEKSPGLKILWLWTFGTAAILITSVVKTRLNDMEKILKEEDAAALPKDSGDPAAAFRDEILKEE